MRIFVDECVNSRLLPHLHGFNLIHCTATPLRGTRNGALLRAVDTDYDVFLTTDQNIAYQQNLKNFSLVFVILQARSNRIEYLLPLVPDTLAVLDRIAQGTAAPGDLFEITAT